MPTYARRAEPAGVLPDAPEEPTVAEPSAPGLLSAAAIREVWPEIMTTLGRKSKRLAALASGATVRDLDGETVVLTFRFPVHAEMVAAESDMINNALYEALGGRWQIRCEVSGEAGGAARTQATAGPVRPPAQKTAARSATTAAARRREIVTPPASTDGDDDWPEPARPGGIAPAADPPPIRHDSAAAGRGVDRTAVATPEPPAPPTVAVTAVQRSVKQQASAAEEPPYDPEYDGPPPGGIAAYEGFDPGDEPLDDVIDEKTARESGEQQAMRLLQDAFGAEKIGEV